MISWLSGPDSSLVVFIWVDGKEENESEHILKFRIVSSALIIQQARLRVTLCKKSQLTAVADPWEGTLPIFGPKWGPKDWKIPPPPNPLYLTVWMTGPLLSQGLDPAMNCAPYLDMIMLDNASDSYSTSSPGTMKKPWGRRWLIIERFHSRFQQLC